MLVRLWEYHHAVSTDEAAEIAVDSVVDGVADCVADDTGDIRLHTTK